MCINEPWAPMTLTPVDQLSFFIPFSIGTNHCIPETPHKTVVLEMLCPSCLAVTIWPLLNCKVVKSHMWMVIVPYVDFCKLPDGNLFMAEQWVLWSYQPRSALLTWSVTWLPAWYIPVAVIIMAHFKCLHAFPLLSFFVLKSSHWLWWSKMHANYSEAQQLLHGAWHWSKWFKQWILNWSPLVNSKVWIQTAIK